MTMAQAHTLAERFQVRSRFADAEVDPGDVLMFADGLPGYESVHQFALLDVPEQAPLKVLHAVNASEPCFLVVDPKSVLPTYRYELSDSDLLRLGAKDDSTLLWLAMVIVDDAETVAVNLRAPIVINPERMTGRQVMPNACVYPLRYVIGQ